jgi:Zn-dependent protease with chaperone function
MSETYISVGLAITCLVVLPLLLRSSRIFDRLPHAGVATWVSLGAVGWISTVVFLLKLGIDPTSQPLSQATVAFVRHLSEGHPLRGLGMVEVVGLSLSLDIIVLFCGALTIVGWRTWRVRREQRAVLDLVSNPAISCMQVLEHTQPLAFYLPGSGGRVVVSTGTLALLDANEVDAVVFHEQGHHHGHHGVFLVPLQTLSSFVKFLPISQSAPRAIRGYLEMMADDFATSRSSRGAVRSALEKAPVFLRPPAGAFGVADQLVERRLSRLDSGARRGIDMVVAIAMFSVFVTIAVSLVALPS